MENGFVGVRFDADVDNYVVIDIETTGLKVGTAEIIEIAALRVRNNEVVDRFVTPVRSTQSIDSTVTQINGGNNEAVMNAPEIFGVLTAFLQFVGDDIVVGHYLERFSLKILNKQLRQHLGKEIENDYVDIYFFADVLDLSELKSKKLLSLCAYYNIKEDRFCGALKDCWLVHKCYSKMMEQFRVEWDAEDTYLERKKELERSTQEMNASDDVKVIRNSWEYRNDGAQNDPVLRCAVLLPMIRYEVEQECFEKELEGELYALRDDLNKGLFKRMTQADIVEVRKDLEFCFQKLGLE